LRQTLIERRLESFCSLPERLSLQSSKLQIPNTRETPNLKHEFDVGDVWLILENSQPIRVQFGNLDLPWCLGFPILDWSTLALPLFRPLRNIHALCPAVANSIRFI
jgi:hypothetical protein